MSGTKRFVEQRIMKNRMKESKDADVRRMLVEHNILAGHGRSEVRVETMRRARSAAAETRDLYIDYSYVKGEQDKERRTRVAQFEENLADELARRKAEQLREEMDRRRICDGSEDLRALKERLHAAKVNKERAMQLLDKEVRKENSRIVDHKIAEHMENERLENVELEHKLNIEKLRQRERVKAINQDQIAQKESQRVQALNEYLKEKDQVQELVDKIAEEDALESAAKHQQQEETRRVLKQFVIEQKQIQEAQEEADRLENERIEAHAQAMRDREARLQAEKDEIERKKQEVLKAQLAVAERASKEKEELEQLRNDLHMEQLEDEARKREELRMRKKLEDREEMKNAYMFQMRMKEEKLRKGQEEEAQIRQRLLEKFAEDDRIEQMNEHKRRMRVEQHKREAQRLMELRREMFDAARHKEREEEEALRAGDGKRQAIIEEERQRLLREHAAQLQDFLPKWTLDNEDDYEMIFGFRPGSLEKMPVAA